MSVSQSEATKMLEYVAEEVMSYTDIVFSATELSKTRLSIEGFGSALSLHYQGERLTVTCEHVTSRGNLVYGGPEWLDKPIAPTSSERSVSPTRGLGNCSRLDLALLEELSSSNATPYPLERSEMITGEWLKAQRGTAAFVHGFWSNKAKCFPYPDGMFYLEAPYYSAIGPLKEVRETEIVGDFAERSILFKNDDAFMQLRNLTPTGGDRDLRGISGSGLWMVYDDSPVLVGVVLGRKPRRRNRHLIRATPVWQLISLAERLL